MTENPSPSKDERILAAASYFTWLAGFWLIGPVALMVWKINASRHVAFHAAQAFVLSVAVTIMVPVCWFLAYLGFMIGVVFMPPDWAGLGYFFGITMMMLSGLVGIALHVWAAWRAFCADGGRMWLVAPLADRILGVLERAPATSAP